MSRPFVTDGLVSGLSFARACVRDQQTAARLRKDHSWDKRYTEALAAIDFIVEGHKRAAKKAAKKAARSAG